MSLEHEALERLEVCLVHLDSRDRFYPRMEKEWGFFHIRKHLRRICRGGVCNNILCNIYFRVSFWLVGV